MYKSYRFPHNFDYVVFLFIAVKVPTSEFGDNAHRMFPLCRCVWYLHLNVQGCLQDAQYPFGWNNRCVQINDEDCAETPFLY